LALIWREKRANPRCDRLEIDVFDLATALTAAVSGPELAGRRRGQL
jgi:hypothetical protein